MKRCRALVASLALMLLVAPDVGAVETLYQKFVNAVFGPAVFWYGTESSGTVANHGTFVGLGGPYDLVAGTSPTYGDPGVNASRSTSLNFTPSQFLHVNKNDSGNGPFDFGAAATRECWVKTTSGTAGAFLSNSDAESGSSANRVSAQFASTTGFESTIYDVNGSTLYSDVIGATGLTSGTWYLLTMTWSGASTHIHTIFINAVQDGQKTTLGGTATADASQWVALGRKEGDDDSYFTGNVQDCYVNISDDSASSAANIVSRYECGIGVTNACGIGNNWPWTSKAPRLPSYLNEGYFAHAVALGYGTGRLAAKARLPLYFIPAWLPFEIMPRGDLR